MSALALFRSRRRAFFAALIVLFAPLCLSACSGGKRDPLSPGAVVLVLGDSISAGYGLDPQHAWPALLAERTGWRVVNGGVSGDTSAQGRARLPALLDEHRPAAVIIELGGNDMLRRVPNSQTVENLEAIISVVQAADARPILMAVPQPSVAGAAFGSLSDADFYAELAKRKRVPVLPDVIADVLSDSSYKLDQLHPNAEGSRVLAEKATQSLKKAGLL